MKKLLAVLTAIVAGVSALFAQTVVTTDAEIRAAIQNDGVTIRVGADIDLSNKTLEIPKNNTVTMDLNGHKLDRKLTKRGEGGGQVITVRQGATLNLSNGTLTGAWGRGGGGMVNEGGTATLTNVVIAGNVAEDRGGGIYNYGTLTMTGGAIANNISQDKTAPEGGGGIFNAQNATATLTNVTITGNKAQIKGGGAICNYGTMTLDGCAVINNTCQLNGGGIWTAANATLKMQGANTVTSNHAGYISSGVGNNLFLKTDAVITVTGSLAGSTICINMESRTGIFTSGYNTHNSGADPATFFQAELPQVMAVTMDGNEAKLGNKLPEGTVYYIERSWDNANKKVTAQIRTLASGSYTTLTGGDDITIQPGYYVVSSNIERDDINLSGNGEHHLILCDGAQLEADLIYVPKGKTLHIYGQAYNSGKLYIPDGVDDYGDQSAAIGGHKDEKAGTIIIHGGTLDIAGHSGSAAIGGGRYGDGGDVTVYAGYVKAKGGTADSGLHGAGIGGGFMGNGGNLTVYGGQIEAEGNYEGGAGIGSGDNYDTDPTAIVARRSRKTEINFDPVTGGTVVVHGGYIEARGGRQSAGIGGGLNGGGANMTVHGGIVKAWGFKNGAGIGTGEWKTDALNYTGELTVTGGEVYAYGSDDAGSPITPGGGAGIGGGRDVNGSNVTVSGGYVYAQGGKYAAGIGSGCEAIFSGGKQGGRLTVTGGHVEAYGGTDAAGIGGGEDADGGTVIISGGYVYAKGNDWGAGIGGGEGADGGKVTITGGTVVARAGRDETGCRAIGPGEGCDEYGSLTLGDDVMVSSERRAAAVERKNMCWYRTQVRVEPCDHSDLTYTVDGTGIHDHHISHCPYCNHTDTAEHTFDEHGVCTVCGVHATAFEAKLYMPQAQPDGSFDGQTYSKTATYLVVPDSVFHLPMATLNVPGYKFIGWEATTEPTEDSYVSPYTTATADTLYRAGNKYKVSGNICFVARYKVADIYLYDDEPNGEILNDYNGMKISKVTLSGRVFNKNNTWQPLALPFSLSADELAASALAGCQLKQLDTEKSYNDAEHHVVYLYFKDTTAIEAGKPYIIRWAAGDPILSPEFANVTLTNKTADAKGNLLLFKSIYSPQTFKSANKKVLYFMENGTIVYPDGQAPVTVGSCRAYFRLTNLMGSDPDADFTITTNLDDEQGIGPVTGNPSPVTLKIIRNGLLFIERNGCLYDAQGQLVK